MTQIFINNFCIHKICIKRKSIVFIVDLHFSAYTCKITFIKVNYTFINVIKVEMRQCLKQRKYFPFK